MKKLAILILCAVFSIASQAQGRLKVSESHGEYFKQKARYISNIYENPSGGYWSIGGGYVQKLDDQLNLVDEKKLDLYYDGNFLRLEQVIRFQDEFYLFMSFINVKKKKKYLFYTVFNPYSLVPEGDIFKVAEVKAATEKRMSASNFSISVSNNENYVLIIGNDAQRQKKQKRSWFKSSSSSSSKGDHVFKFTYWVMDKNMTIVNYVKRHELEIENSSDKFWIRQVTVDDSGSVYILGKNTVIEDMKKTTGERLRDRNGPSIESAAFILEKIDKDGFSYQYKTPENEIYVDMRLLFKADGTPLLVGLSGQEHEKYGGVLTTGVYRVTLDFELNVLQIQNQEFTQEVLEGVNNIREQEADMSDRRRRRRERRDSRLSDEQLALKELAKSAALNINSIEFAGIDENGDPVLVLEEQYVRVVTHTTTNSNGTTTTTTTYYYYYEDLILVKFTDDEVLQSFYNKSYMLVNRPLIKSLDVSLKGGNVTILSQTNAVRATSDLSSVKAYDLRAFDKKQDVKWSNKRVFTYRKSINEDVMLAAAQYKRRIMWYKFEIKN